MEKTVYHPALPLLTLRHVTSMYPNIRALVTILCTLPVTSCSAERSFSGLKRIKTPFRSVMTTSRLSGLTLLNVHRDIPIDIEAAIDEFATLHPRRVQVVDILKLATNSRSVWLLNACRTPTDALSYMQVSFFLPSHCAVWRSLPQLCMIIMHVMWRWRDRTIDRVQIQYNYTICENTF